MSGGTFAAIDLGASSGRVMVGLVGPGRLELQEVHRFPNDPIALPDGLHWDVLRIYHEVIDGLRRAARAQGELASVGIDTWGVDFGLMDTEGRLLGNPYHYRDPRTNASSAAVHAVIPRERLYPRNGLQFMPFNSVYQLAAARDTAELRGAATMLLMPDLLGYWLSGIIGAEMTNASTTGLLRVDDRTWDVELLDQLDLPRSILPPLRQPGDVLGGLRTEVLAATGLPDPVRLTLVGSHDTASAVVGVPAESQDFAYISSGTWSLVGVELDAPVTSEASRLANFTNEGGVDGRVRYHRNVMGLWLLQECLRSWELAGSPEALTTLLDAAGELPPGGPAIDPDAAVFLPPGDMPARISAACRRTDQPVPASRPALVRCILDSLALAYARTIEDARRLSGRDVRVVHLVGGGSRNTLLCQLTANACRIPVVAGPVEATALGNVLVQGRAHGHIQGGLEVLRALVRATHPLRRYEPAGLLETPS
ncbi:MAG: rhamnulokinase family protein [Candidatus Limnocylindrales bacterium]